MSRGRKPFTEKQFEDWIKTKNVFMDEIELFYTDPFHNIIDKANEIANDKKRKLNRKIKNEEDKFEYNLPDSFFKEEYEKLVTRYKTRKGTRVLLYESDKARPVKNEIKQPLDSCWAITLENGDSFYVLDAWIDKYRDNDYVDFLKSIGYKHYKLNEFKHSEPRLHYFKSVTQAAVFIYNKDNKTNYERINNEQKKKEAQKIIKNTISSNIRKALRNDKLIHNVYDYLIVAVDDIA